MSALARPHSTITCLHPSHIYSHQLTPCPLSLHPFISPLHLLLRLLICCHFHPQNPPTQMFAIPPLVTSQPPQSGFSGFISKTSQQTPSFLIPFIPVDPKERHCFALHLHLTPTSNFWILLFILSATTTSPVRRDVATGSLKRC